MAIELTVRADYADYKSAIWLIIRKRWVSLRMLRIPLILFVVYFAVYLVAFCLRCGTGTHVLKWAFMEAWPSALIVTFAWMAFCALCIAVRSRKTFTEVGTMEEDTEATFDELGFAASAESGSVKLRWDQIKHFLRNDRVLVLQRTANLMHMIPTSKLDPAVTEQIVALMRAGGVKQR